MGLGEECNERRTLSPSERTRAALFVPRAARALAGGSLLRIPPADGSGLLESLALLDRGDPRARNYRAFYHSRLHGYCDGARRFWLRHSRGRIARLGQQASPHVV